MIDNIARIYIKVLSLALIAFIGISILHLNKEERQYKCYKVDLEPPMFVFSLHIYKDYQL